MKYFVILTVSTMITKTKEEKQTLSLEVEHTGTQMDLFIYILNKMYEDDVCGVPENLQVDFYTAIPDGYIYPAVLPERIYG